MLLALPPGALDGALSPAPGDAATTEVLPVRLGYFLPQIGPAAGPDAISAVARRAEEIGYDSLWVTERLLSPLEPQTPYPSPDGVLPDEYRTVIDPLSTLAYAAAQTSRIAVGTSVLNIPWYNPALLARALTGVDVLSKGRLRVGLGTGWSVDEYEAVGVPWTERGRRADENIEALKAIWTTDPVEVAGGHFRIPRSIIGPKPVQKPHPPIYMAAYTPPAMARVARFADGWMPVGVPLEGIAGMFEQITSQARDAGRDPDAIELIVRGNVEIADRPIEADRFIFTGTLEQIAEDVAACRDIGAAELTLDATFDPGTRTADDFLARLDDLWKLVQSA
jgi:probable F420-dependent oxidoreductase